MKSMLRKNFTKGYSDIQVKVREATSNEDWGPTMTQLEEIARASYNPTQFSDIIYIIDKRLNDHGKNWRHVYKTLIVLEFCICCGADSMVTFAKERLYEVKTLREFISIDDHGTDNGACVREKSKDIVALLTEEHLLSEARKNKNPPLVRRPSSTGPLTIQKGDFKNAESLPIGGGAGDTTFSNGSRKGSTIIDNRRKSFEDLQNIDEDTAMEMALQESKAEFESSKSLLQERDAGYPILLQNMSRSSSAKSSSANLNEKEQTGPLTAEQILDLDDESFAQALDSSYLGSRRESGNLSIILGSPNNPQQLFVPPFTTSNYSKNPFDSTTYLDGRGGGGQTAVGLVVPGTNSHAQSETLKDPFSFNTFSSEYDKSSTGYFDDPNQRQTTLSSIHPIAIPGNNYSDLTIGAKPVIPGTIAPQFSNKPTIKQIDNTPLETPIVKVQPGLKANEPSEADRDPFADLY